MYRKEVNAQSPLRILDKSIHGGLGPGNLGVIMARAGVGKTACLVQIGLDDLMRERPVLHVALEQTVEHVQSWYDALFDDLAARTDLQKAEAVRALLAKNRIIQSFTDHDIWPARLEKAVEMFKAHLDFKPSTILVDGYNWSAHSVAENAAMIGAFKAQAKLLGAELWISAQTHREGATERTGKLAAPWDQYQGLIDVALLLEPQNHHVSLRLLKDHDHADVAATHLVLHPDTLRIVPEGEERAAAIDMPPSAHTLLSGGAKGAEAAFGACAERWGLAELNFSFEGRSPTRTRGVVRLTEEELAEGAVSSRYLEAHMHRSYPQTPLFQKTLQTIWHQVNTASEVFSVGTILEDNTVKGGTGWAAELARHWKKPVHVFDQERKGWYHWDGHDWVEEAPPKIQGRRFTGTGTRFLSEDGLVAIQGLFERSFGPAPGDA
jgi:KaiC/GvpD/RAD55 family RecA-like ATPase